MIHDPVRIQLPSIFDTEMTRDPQVHTVVIERADYPTFAEEVARHGDPVRADVKGAPDDALEAVQRLSDERDALRSQLASSKAAHEAVWRLFQQRGERIFGLQGEKADLRERAETAERERDNYKRAYELNPATMRLEGPGAEGLADRIDDIEELRATIVSQAREIARLKGEST